MTRDQGQQVSARRQTLFYGLKPLRRLPDILRGAGRRFRQVGALHLNDGGAFEDIRFGDDIEKGDHHTEYNHGANQKATADQQADQFIKSLNLAQGKILLLSPGKKPALFLTITIA